ncbi:MAG: PqiC family protein [Candidatus Omnitrophota bacterium]
MKQKSFVFCAGVVCVFFVLALYGCISVANSQTPRFYTLRAIADDQVSKKFNISSQVIIGIGPVEIPEYLNRPHMVTQNKDRTLNFAQFDRWGESLDLAFKRLVHEDLSAMIGGATLQMFPWSFAIPVKYQVVVSVMQLESALDKDLFFVAQWSIIDLERKEMVFTKRSQFRQAINPHSYAGLAQALSEVCVSLSSEIAEELASQAVNTNTRKKNPASRR